MEGNTKDDIDDESLNTLNVLCAICSEYFKNSDVINSTWNCGHVFHRDCLFRWMSYSHTCPQCRCIIHKQNVQRLFLNFSTRSVGDESDGKPIDRYEWKYLAPGATVEDLSNRGFAMGTDEEGDPIYAARVLHREDLLPCYYVPKVKGVYAAYGCRSHFLTENIELLYINNDSAEYKWVLAKDGFIPSNSFGSGYTIQGEPLYTARALHNGKLLYGKFHPTHCRAYMPYKEEEVNNSQYEVLIRIRKDQE